MVDMVVDGGGVVGVLGTMALRLLYGAMRSHLCHRASCGVCYVVCYNAVFVWCMFEWGV